MFNVLCNASIGYFYHIFIVASLLQKTSQGIKVGGFRVVIGNFTLFDVEVPAVQIEPFFVDCLLYIRIA